MTQDQIVEIASGKANFEAAQHFNKSFLELIALLPQPRDIPSQIQVRQGVLEVGAFGFVAKAVPRTVRFSDGSFSTEYVFEVKTEDEPIEVSRFYLIKSGKLVADEASSSVPLSDFNTSDATRMICGRVVLGILHSPLLAARGVA